MGVQLNKAKAIIKTDELNFIGHIITSQGLKPDPSKVGAIVDMDHPKEKEGIWIRNGNLSLQVSTKAIRCIRAIVMKMQSVK